MLNAYQTLGPRRANPETQDAADRRLINTLDDVQRQYKETFNMCPECGLVMVDMGLDLKAPKKSDVKSWKLLEGMYRMGHCFYSCGCTGFGYVPKNTFEYKAYLYQQLAGYQADMDRISNAFGGNHTAKQDAQLWWAERIATIKREIDRVV
ncbi:MAG: hypothetical protein H0T53_05510 [Herpetosiphonaceae bacterium]|nr:hypothetical protein [Herpetosiphonaceae bacterium]